MPELYSGSGQYEYWIERALSAGEKCMSKIEIIKGDITKPLGVSAIVNAANNSLLGGGGVDGAIHYAAGPELLEECRKLYGCRTGEAKITKAYRLPCEYVIHTVGPVYVDGAHGEAEKLADCYTGSLALAKKYGIRTIAFPAISTGVYGYPHDEAAKVALNAVFQVLLNGGKDDFDRILFVMFSERMKEIYEKTVAEEYSHYSYLWED